MALLVSLPLWNESWNSSPKKTHPLLTFPIFDVNKFSSSKLLKTNLFSTVEIHHGHHFFLNTPVFLIPRCLTAWQNAIIFLSSFFPSVDCIALFVSFCPEQVNSNCQISRGGSKEGRKWLTEVKSCLSLIFWVLFFKRVIYGFGKEFHLCQIVAAKLPNPPPFQKSRTQPGLH